MITKLKPINTLLGQVCFFSSLTTIPAQRCGFWDGVSSVSGYSFCTSFQGCNLLRYERNFNRERKHLKREKIQISMGTDPTAYYMMVENLCQDRIRKIILEDNS